MTSAYVFGPIHLFGQDYLPTYKKLMEVCARYFDRTIGTYPDFWDSKESPKKFYKRTIDTITKCDLFIAEVSSPSHGVGMELQMGCENKIPIIALAKDGVGVSTMVMGLPNLYKLIRYKDVKELTERLDEELVKFSKLQKRSKLRK